MLFALIILIIGTILCGMFFKDILTGGGNNFFSNAIFNIPSNKKGDVEYSNLLIKNIPIIGTSVGVTLGVCLNKIL
jgi:hypothetical protein